MTRDEALTKLVSVRHHCFVRGVLNDESGFREAFRDVNRLYVKLRDEAKRRTPKICSGGRPRKYSSAVALRGANAEYQRSFRQRRAHSS